MSKETTNEEIVLEDNQIICALTDQIKPAKNKELTLQSLIAMLNEEYGFEMAEWWGMQAGTERIVIEGSSWYFSPNRL